MKDMKEKIIYIATIILCIFIGVSGTIIVTKYFPLDAKAVADGTVKNVNITETNTIKDAIDKVYNSVYVIETYKGNNKVSTGTGFAYKKDAEKGYVITNHHVIADGDSVKLIDVKGDTITGTILGSDEFADIAVIAVDAKKVLGVATMGDSTKAELGDTLFTVGSPLGAQYAGTVTKGTLSGKNRSVTVTLSNGDFLMEVLQTDAAVNPGNSGGPLVNINGQVIGVISLKLVQDEIEGMGFAIPIETVMAYTDRLEKGEKIQRPLLGVALMDASNTFALYQNGITLNSDVTEGAVVVTVDKDSVADKAGLKKGDVILELNGDKIKDLAHFRFKLYKYSIGDTVKIKYYRDNKISETTAILTKSID